MAQTLSPYNYENIFAVHEDSDGFLFYNLFNTIKIDGEIDSSLYDEYYFGANDDFYSLAYKFYNDIRLYWTILIANNIINPFDDELIGQKIKILKANVISEILKQIKSK